MGGKSSIPPCFKCVPFQAYLLLPEGVGALDYQCHVEASKPSLKLCMECSLTILLITVEKNGKQRVLTNSLNLFRV